MMSPPHAAKPAGASPLLTLCLLTLCCVTILTSGQIQRATATVSSAERPTTSTTSSTHSGSVAEACGILAASLMAGMTTLTPGVMARTVETGRYGSSFWDAFAGPN